MESTTKPKQKPIIILSLPNDLLKEMHVVLLHAHMQNITAPQMGFRYHAWGVLAQNNLFDLDVSQSDS